MKCTSAVRQLAYDIVPRFLDEYLKAQVSGMLGNLDCTDWEWFGSPYEHKGQYVRREHGLNPFILAPEILFVANGVTYPWGYYLVNGINPELATLVKTIQEPSDDDYKRIRYKQMHESAKKDVNECVESIEVMDVQRAGLQFTWNQKPKGKDGILKKLDRVMANLEFQDSYVGAHAVLNPYQISDHSPSVLTIPSLVKVKPKPFKFYNVTILNERFKEVVSEGSLKHVSGFHMFRVVKKLKGLKKPIRKLMYDKGNLHANVIRLRDNLDWLQTDLDKDLSNVNLREDEAAAVIAFNEALVIEEKFLKQKEKIAWLNEGDSNSAYFHKAIKSQISRSRINVVTDAEGVVFQNDDVAKAFISHYEVFLGQPGITHKFNTTDLFLTRLSSSEALEMVRTVSSQEVKTAIFFMGNDKSPGPDGFTAAFFKDTWDIIGPDVTRAVCEFFINGHLLRELNHTIIALIPKVNSPARVNDYRPISCCNVLFKCISKIIANRLKDSLKRLVSPNQSAFVPGRSISDNILLTQEIMHNYHLDRGVPRCAFKVDIQKAYDTVDWEFLRVILIGFGFHVRMVSWIMECVATTSFSISINGSLHGYFKGERGLCQGDHLSPYLFTLIMEVLTLMLHRKTSTQLELLKEGLLDGFKDALGLVLSFPKSTNYFCNVLNHTKLAILHILPFEEGRLPVKYLGVPLVSSRLIFRDCKELIVKVQDRNMRKGKAKVWWEAVCLPKDKGGLGVILKNRSFWDIPYRGNMTWGWRKILQLRPLIREFIWYCIGDGSQASMWFDRWCAASPIYNIVSSRDIFRAGFDLNSKVPVISVDKRDYLEWRVVDMRVMEKPFTVHLCVERYSVLRENVHLKTQDLLNQWDVAVGLATVWSQLKQFAGLTGLGSSLASIMSILLPIAKRKSSKSIIGKLVVAATAYFVWQERNQRLFKHTKQSAKEVTDCIMSSVHMKLLSCHLKKSKDGVEFVCLWELPKSTLK
ncbi:hypothetical protein Tco_0004120 [Tanacetum coccineum]